ncbi:hypothetical protein [Chenggangzhangella methanolivorans]|uniref:Uncharacterized protein n=1 Tax=Chenggangzhangella methanolivorans TaxID=1437009 RepID=A0A9E6UIE4_9HYPH|nr:hypothetical protein [Chenggangzhangella methanolivorans]QZO00768.1 hypothetical protein K6K41_03560 [Chenggangzhangella methanolivorans]
MRTIASWTAFAAATTLVWLVGGFSYLFLSRLYDGLQIPTMKLFALFVMSAATSLAAISFASKLDERDDPEAADMAARRARPDERGGR